VLLLTLIYLTVSWVNCNSWQWHYLSKFIWSMTPVFFCVITPTVSPIVITKQMLTRWFFWSSRVVCQGVSVDQGSLRGSRRGTLSTPCRPGIAPATWGEGGIPWRFERPVPFFTLKTTRELQKNHRVNQSPRESLKRFINKCF
jgi:hypothetical protein